MENQMQAQQRVVKDFFAYQINFSALAAGGQDTGNINIQADSAFQLQKLAFFADIAAATQTNNTRVIPLVTIQMTDTGSGRNLFSSAVPVPSIFGTGDLPFILPSPKEFSPKATISIVVSNFSAATAYNLRLSLIGQKVFRL